MWGIVGGLGCKRRDREQCTAGKKWEMNLRSVQTAGRARAGHLFPTTHSCADMGARARSRAANFAKINLNWAAIPTRRRHILLRFLRFLLIALLVASFKAVSYVD